MWDGRDSIKADLHSHTIYSHDSCNTEDKIIKSCRMAGINCLAVTDHNEIDGAFALRERAPFRIIIGEEIDTGEGELIGLFITSRILPGRGLHETIDSIKAQRGIVYVPHPLSMSRKTSLNTSILNERVKDIDIIEFFNSRTRHESADRNWLDKLYFSDGIIKGAGSDAHSPYEFGNVIVQMGDFNDPEGFLRSLSSAKFLMKKSPFFLRLIMNHKTRKILRWFQ